jgi:hypothetical protein
MVAEMPNKNFKMISEYLKYEYLKQKLNISQNL